MSSGMNERMCHDCFTCIRETCSVNVSNQITNAAFYVHLFLKAILSFMDWDRISEWALLYLDAQLIIRLVSTVSTAYTWVVAITKGCSLDQPLLGPWRFQELCLRKLVWMTICWGCRIESDICHFVSRLEVFTFWDLLTIHTERDKLRSRWQCTYTLAKYSTIQKYVRYFAFWDHETSQ